MLIYTDRFLTNQTDNLTIYEIHKKHVNANKDICSDV